MRMKYIHFVCPLPSSGEWMLTELQKDVTSMLGIWTVFRGDRIESLVILPDSESYSQLTDLPSVRTEERTGVAAEDIHRMLLSAESVLIIDAELRALFTGILQERLLLVQFHRECLMKIVNDIIDSIRTSARDSRPIHKKKAFLKAEEWTRAYELKEAQGRYALRFLKQAYEALWYEDGSDPPEDDTPDIDTLRMYALSMRLSQLLKAAEDHCETEILWSKLLSINFIAHG